MKKVENLGNQYTTDDGKIYNYVSNYTYPNTSFKMRYLVNTKFLQV